MQVRPEINFQRTPVILIVAAVAVALELVCTIDETRRVAYYNDYLGLLPCIWTGQLWRPFTTSLLHANPLHAAFNIYWLLIFGPALEHRFGSYRMLGLIVLLGYVSMLPEYIIGSYHRDKPIMIVGLSGIVYGLFGMVWIGRRWRSEFRDICDDMTVNLLVAWFFLCIVLTYTEVMNVANIAHGAGAGFGVLYGLAAFHPRYRLQWTLAAVAATCLVLATLIGCPGHRGYENIKAFRGWARLERAGSTVSRPMEMHVLPAAVLPLPDAGLFEPFGHRAAGIVQTLHQADVADDRHVVQEPDVGGTDRRVVRTVDPTEVEVEVVELHAFDQVAAGLRFERG